MAASVYATPPPDLSGEDTALSDVSNSSQISSSSSTKATKRNLTSLLSGGGGSVDGNSINVNNPIRTNSTSSSSASNIYDPSLLDQSKKRRKQTTPIRISALNLSTDSNILLAGSKDDIQTTDNNNETTTDIQLNNSGTGNRGEEEEEECDEEDDVEEENEDYEKTDDSHLNNNDEKTIIKTIEDDNNQQQINKIITDSEKVIIEENGDKSENEINKIENKNNDNQNIVIVNNKEDKDIADETTISQISTSPLIEKPKETLAKSPKLLINPVALLNSNISFTSIEKIKENIKLNSAEEISVIPQPPPPLTPNAQQKLINLNVENEKDVVIPSSIQSDILQTKNNGEKNLLLLKECEECKEKFDSDLKLSVHILQVHTVPKVHIIPKVQNSERRDYHVSLPPQLLASSKQQQQPSTQNPDTDNDSRDDFDTTMPLKIKLENTNDYGNDSSPPPMPPLQGNIDNNQQQHKISVSGIGSNMPRPEEWLSSMSGLGFPFPPEAAAAAALSASNYLSQLPLLGVPSVGAFSSVDGCLSRPPLRIFNPEAYCDLCNKEFCNKYFLKTHKANKHGIYDPNISSSDNLANNPLNQITQVLQMQFQQQQLEQQQQQQHHHQQQQQQMQQVQPSSSSSSSQPLPPLPQQPGTQQQISNQQALMPPELTVFCDICNKKFTNIFAMKRHRSKAHEIPPPINSPNNIIKSTQQLQELSPEHQLNEKDIILTNNNTNNTSISSSSSSSSSSVTNPATTITTITSTSITNTTTRVLTPPSTLLRMPEGFREDFTLEQEDVSFTPQPRKLSPSSSQQAREANFAYDKLKRLGVINPEAFCDLCCKEYCNKYFLRTHKLKRHGIFMPMEDGGKDEKLPWPFMQQMQQLQMQMQPLNLMMAGGGGEKLSRRLSDGILIGDGFKKIRLDSNLINSGNCPSDDGQQINGQNNEKINDSGGGTTNIGGINPGKGFEMPENFNQMMLEGITNSSSHDPEPISIDLQKLQSMILQLNDLNGQRPVSCHFCGKDMENQYILQAHIVTEHSAENHSLLSSLGSGLVEGVLGGGIGGGMKILSHPSSPTNSNQTEICKQCDKEFAGLIELKQHIIEYHGLLLNSPLRDGFITPERSINLGGGGGGSSTGPGTPNHMDRKQQQQFNVTPTSSYCEICNKELCNKYFMKTHMQRMHGIEIENGAQIGGVVCNICNKELCSKYFLRVHKTNSHGVVDEGSPLPQQPIRQLGSSSSLSGGGGGVNDGVMTPESESIYQALENKQDLAELSTRYFTHYTEVCPLCSRRFRSAKWLRAHLMSDHGKAGTDKLRELEQHMSFGKSENSPTLKIPNGNAVGIFMGGGSNSSGSGGGGMSLSNIDPNILAKSPFPSLFMNENSSVNSQQQQQHQQTQQQQQRNKEYQCSMCPFSTPYYAFLFIHERSHSILSTNNSIKSETAISIAKEQQQHIPDVVQQPEQHENDNEHDHEHEHEHEHIILHHHEDEQEKRRRESTLSGTPPATTITPASTPIPQTAQETAANSSKKVDEDDIIPIDIDEAIKTKINNNNNNNNNSSSNSNSNNSSNNNNSNINSNNNYITNNLIHRNSLNELANFTNRPASYAIPHNFDGEIMQSFLIEEKHKTPTTPSDDNSTIGNDDLMTTAAAASNRFVPAVVYLPVRERISGPITVSFTLTPA